MVDKRALPRRILLERNKLQQLETSNEEVQNNFENTALKHMMENNSDRKDIEHIEYTFEKEMEIERPFIFVLRRLRNIEKT